MKNIEYNFCRTSSYFWSIVESRRAAGPDSFFLAVTREVVSSTPTGPTLRVFK